MLKMKTRIIKLIENERPVVAEIEDSLEVINGSIEGAIVTDDIHLWFKNEKDEEDDFEDNFILAYKDQEWEVIGGNAFFASYSIEKDIYSLTDKQITEVQNRITPVITRTGETLFAIHLDQ